MKHLKIYENYYSDNDNPKIDDYILVKNYIGKIIDIDDDDDYQYLVKFEDEDYDGLGRIGYVGNDDTRWISSSNIRYFSNNIEDVEIFLNSKKYNI